mgnify:CR=1 FL=1
MTPIQECIKNKNTRITPIWLMRQAGRYLPEFREIRSKNTNFINLCLNPKLSKEITLQPLKRFSLDAAIIFSDILLIPFALDQEVEFEKNFGPKLGQIDVTKTLNISETKIINKLSPVYELIKETSRDEILSNKDLIGFIGGTWTLLVYMLNKKSPKKLNKEIFNIQNEDRLIQKIIKTQKLHIKNQVESGAQIIQIFDSWAGLLKEKDLSYYTYNPTLSLVNYVKSLNVPVICFPRGIKNYKDYCEIVKPDTICIDYEVDPIKINKEIKIPVQGGMDPKVLLSDKENLKKEAIKYLDIFKDHPYIFNLGHGILPETDPNMMDYLVKTVKDY